MTPDLSVVVVAGGLRGRAQRVIDALEAQQPRERVEVIIIDRTPPDTPPLRVSPATRYERRPGLLYYNGRAEGTRLARADYVAFVEDHCYPQPGWAQALIEAFREGPWDAVGYAFVSANPGTYLSMACLFSDYGQYMHPVPRGVRRHVAGNNVAYPRKLLLDYGDRLADMFSPDFVLQDILSQRGARFFLESRALAAHENYESMGGLLGANFHYCRLMGAKRASTQNWGAPRRLFYGIAVLPAAPLLKWLRAARAMLPRRSLWAGWLASQPIILLTYAVSAVGESLGYLRGAGSSVERFDHFEVEHVRAANAT